MFDEFDPNDLVRIRAEGSYFVDLFWEDEEPEDYQAEFLDSQSRRKTLRWGRQSGKSWGLGKYALWKGATIPGSNVLITSDSQRQANELFRAVKASVRTSKLDDEQWGIEENKKTEIIFEHGGRIKAIPTGDDGSTIRGFTADVIIVDEAAFVNDTVFTEVLAPMLATKPNGEFVLASTPHGKSGFYYEKCRHDENWEEFYMPSTKAPRVQDEFIEEQQKQLTDMEYRQEIQAEFVESADAFFSSDDIENAVADEVERESAECYLGADIARFGADKSVFVTLDKEGNVFETQVDKDKPLTHAAGRVQNIDEACDPTMILIDETGLGGGSVDMLKQEMDGIRRMKGVKLTLDKKAKMYNALKKLLEEGEITLPNNLEMKAEMKEMQYDLTSSGKTKLHHPEGGHDDWCDALALAAWAYKRRQGARGSGKIHQF